MIEDIRTRLAAYTPQEIPVEGRPVAAVLIPIYRLGDNLHIVLTKRTDRVEHHKGEISFPGGARDHDDADLMATALRESWEEVGLHPKHVEVIGRVDHYVTNSQFHVTPFVGMVDPYSSPYPWRPHEREVAMILEVPFAHLLDPANMEMEARIQSDGRVSHMESFRWGEHVVWGATARILKNFMDVAVAVPDTRVTQETATVALDRPAAVP